MITLTFNNLNFEISDEILKISDYVKNMFKDYPNEPIPLTSTNETIFNIFMKWFNILKAPTEISYPWFVENFYETDRFIKLGSPGIVFRTHMFEDYDLKTLIDLFNFASANRIRMLAETIAYAIALRNVNLTTSTINSIPVQFSLIILVKQFGKYKLNLGSQYKKHRYVYEYHPSLFDENALLYSKYEWHYYGLKSLTYIMTTDFDKDDCIFYDGVKFINLPNTISHIPESFCRSRRQLKYVNIPETVKFIRRYAFMNCHRLNNIHIPKSVKAVAGDIFSECRDLTEIKFYDGVKNIDSKRGYKVYYYCDNLKTIYPEYLK